MYHQGTQEGIDEAAFSREHEGDLQPQAQAPGERPLTQLTQGRQPDSCEPYRSTTPLLDKLPSPLEQQHHR